MTDKSEADSHSLTFLDDGGDMAALIRSYDWTTTPLGAIASWPPALRAILAFMLHSPVPLVMLWGEDGIMLYNDAYSVFAGGAHPRLLGSKVREGWPEVADFNDNVMKVGLAGGTLNYRNHVLSLNRTGTFEDVLLNLDYSPVYDDAGRPAGVMAVVFEVTEAVKAERELRDSEARLRFLDQLRRETTKTRNADEILAITTRMVGEHLGISNCAYADIDPDQKGFTIRGDWNAPGLPSIVGHYGFSDFGSFALRELNAGRPVIVDDNAAKLTTEAARTFLDMGVSATICMPLIMGGRLTALMAINDKQPRAWSAYEVATIREVTERSWAHVERVRSEAELRRIADALQELNDTLEVRVVERAEALQQSEATIRTVFETSFMNQGLLNPDGTIVYLNRTTLDSISVRLDQVVGTDFWDMPSFVGTPGISEQVRDIVRRAAAGEVVTTALSLRSPNGDRFYEFSMRPAKDADGNVVALVPEAVETTARVRAEEALRQAQKMEAVGQLTGGLAHDFNNLLAAISGNLEMLQRRIADGRVNGLERYIVNAQSGAQRAASLTQRLLAFSRRQTLDPRPTDVNRLIADMDDLIRRSVGPNIELEFVAAAGLWTARIDIPQLESSLLNLCINARDAMAPDGGRLTIETANKWLDESTANERHLDPGQYISICVTDTGTGMAPEVIARAFDPFFTTKPLGEGTGLGLSMVYGFARQSGGQVRIYSEPGQGTTMCIYLPRHHGPAVEEVRPVSEPSGHGDGEIVLVIDDEPTIRALIVELLEDAGYQALEAHDGPSGLMILQSDVRIDLLISDVGLPGGLNGRQLADAARISRPDLKVLFITGFAENAAVGNGHLAPGMEVITKPFAVALLARKIRDMIEG